MARSEIPLDRKSRTRIELLRAMIETAATVGYAESSVQKVIAEAGVARSTFYAHFRDRDACFLAALDCLAAAASVVAAAAAAAAAADRGPGAATKAVVHALTEFAEREPAGAKVLFVESLAGGETALRCRERLIDRIGAAVADPGATGSVATSVSATLIGGTFRLLAMRMRHSNPNLGGLGEELTEWIDAYELPVRTIEPGAAASHENSPANPDARRRPSVAKLDESQRQRILRATATCSYERGYQAVRVSDILTAAQVSRKTFYHQFHDKAEAATEANESLFQAALSACAGAFFGTGSWPDRVWAGGSALLAFLAAHPHEAHLGFVETHAIGPEAAQHVYDRLEAFTLFLEEGYRQRPEADQLPRATSEALAAVMFELVFRELREHHGLDRLLLALPTLAYLTLTPFVGAGVARAFVSSKMS